MSERKNIQLNGGYSLVFSSVDDWDICRDDGSKVNKNNLPNYVKSLVMYVIITEKLEENNEQHN